MTDEFPGVLAVLNADRYALDTRKRRDMLEAHAVAKELVESVEVALTPHSNMKAMEAAHARVVAAVAAFRGKSQP